MHIKTLVAGRYGIPTPGVNDGPSLLFKAPEPLLMLRLRGGAGLLLPLVLANGDEAEASPLREALNASTARWRSASRVSWSSIHPML